MHLNLQTFHPLCVRQSLPYSLFLHLRRINNKYDKFLKLPICFKLVDRLWARGYDKINISGAFTQVINQDRLCLLYGMLRKKLLMCIFISI